MCALYEWEKSFVIHLSVDNVPVFSWLSEWEFTWRTRDLCGISTHEALGRTPDRNWARSNCIFKVSVPQKCFMLKHTCHFQLETHFHTIINAVNQFSSKFENHPKSCLSHSLVMLPSPFLWYLFADSVAASGLLCTVWKQIDNIVSRVKRSINTRLTARSGWNL